MGRLKNPKTDYSRIAKYYDKVRSEATPALVSRIIKYGKIGEYSVVLDVGCGTGRYTLSLPTMKNLLCALDRSIELRCSDKPLQKTSLQEFTGFEETTRIYLSKTACLIASI